jgi:cytidine deaminase
VLFELGGPECVLDTPRGVRSLAEVLPDAFTL